MALIRSLLFALLFYPGTLLYVLTVIAVSPIGDAPVQAVVHAWSKFHHWLVRNVLGIRIEWDGAIPDGPYLIAVKHQSMFETVDTLHFADTPGGGDEARADRHPAVRLGDAALRRDRSRPRGRRQGAARDDGARPRRRSPAAGRSIIFPGRHARPVRRRAAAAAGLRRPLPRARPAGGSGRASTAGGCGTRASSSAAGRSTSRSAR